MSLFYCPNCNETEIGKITYNEKDIIYNNCRGGYGLMLHYVICRNCGYPLAAYVNNNRNDTGEIVYYKSVIKAYQNGEYATKEEMLKKLKKTHLKGYSVVAACNKFLETI